MAWPLNYYLNFTLALKLKVLKLCTVFYFDLSVQFLVKLYITKGKKVIFQLKREKKISFRKRTTGGQPCHHKTTISFLYPPVFSLFYLSSWLISSILSLSKFMCIDLSKLYPNLTIYVYIQILINQYLCTYFLNRDSNGDIRWW